MYAYLGFYYELGDNSHLTFITATGCEASPAIHAAAINGHLHVAKYLNTRVDKSFTEKQQQIEERRTKRTQASTALGQG